MAIEFEMFLHCEKRRIPLASFISADLMLGEIRKVATEQTSGVKHRCVSPSAVATLIGISRRVNKRTTPSLKV